MKAQVDQIWQDFYEDKTATRRDELMNKYLGLVHYVVNKLFKSMNRQFLRQLLLSSSGRFLRWSKQLHGAADKMVPQSKLFLSDCIEAEWKNVSPCFVLSTGRSGTLLLTRILELAENAAPLHADCSVTIKYEQLAKDPMSVLNDVKGKAQSANNYELQIAQNPPAEFPFRSYADRSEQRAEFQKLLDQFAAKYP